MIVELFGFFIAVGVLCILVRKLKECEKDYHRGQVVPFPRIIPPNPIAQGNLQNVPEPSAAVGDLPA
jgi:hypothetical protein